MYKEKTTARSTMLRKSKSNKLRLYYKIKKLCFLKFQDMYFLYKK